MEKIFVGLLFLLSNQLFAQITFGPKLGVGLSLVNYTKVQDREGTDDTYENPKNSCLVVPMIFGMVNIPINKTFSIRSGIGFRQQSYSYVFCNNDAIPWQTIYFTRTDIISSRLNFVEFPLYVSTKMPFCKRKFELILGASVAMNLGGSGHVDRFYSGDTKGYSMPSDASYETTVNVGESPAVDSYVLFSSAYTPYSTGIYSKKYNYSILAGIGYQVTNRILLNLETFIGLTNLRTFVNRNSYMQADGDSGEGYVTINSLSLCASYMFGGKKNAE